METFVPSESALLERARKFEPQALAEIYDGYSPGLYRYAIRLLGDQSLAEECVAETFSRFLHALKEHKGPHDHVQAYLYRMAHNWIVDLYRRDPPPEELAEDHQDALPGPETTAEERMRDARLRSAIRKLTGEQQQVILLKYMEEMDNESVARIMSKPIGAVKSLQRRALTRLQRLLQEDIV